MEKELRNIIRKKGVLDAEAYSLRKSLRVAYTTLLLHHYEDERAPEVETNLWKSVFYKVIEEYRARLRRTRSKGAAGREKDMRRLAKALQDILQSAEMFYLKLIEKFVEAFSLDEGACLTGAAKLGVSQPYLSCYRSYIYLGDLTRYRRDLPGSTAAAWAPAFHYYNRALWLLPGNGHACNQLAVLATYEEDDFTAMVYYMRSLASEQPFATTKENITALFEKVRQKTEVLKEAYAAVSRKSADPKVLLRWFLLVFMRIHGILFSDAGADRLSQTKTLALKLLEALLGPSDHRRSGMAPIPEFLLLRIFVVNIFSVWWAGGGDGAAGGQTAKPAMLRHAVKISLEFLGRTARVVRAGPRGATAYLGPLSLTLQWLAHQYSTLAAATAGDGGPWQQVWRTVTGVLNQILRASTQTPAELAAPALAPRPSGQATTEEMEVVGFLPLAKSMAGVTFRRDVAAETDEAWCAAIRTGRLFAAALDLEHHGGSATLTYNPQRNAFEEARRKGGRAGAKGRSTVAGTPPHSGAAAAGREDQGDANVGPVPSGSIGSVSSESSLTVTLQPKAPAAPAAAGDRKRKHSSDRDGVSRADGDDQGDSEDAEDSDAIVFQPRVRHFSSVPSSGGPGQLMSGSTTDGSDGTGASASAHSSFTLYYKSRVSPTPSPGGGSLSTGDAVASSLQDLEYPMAPANSALRPMSVSAAEQPAGQDPWYKAGDGPGERAPSAGSDLLHGLPEFFQKSVTSPALGECLVGAPEPRGEPDEDQELLDMCGAPPPGGMEDDEEPAELQHPAPAYPPAGSLGARRSQDGTDILRCIGLSDLPGPHSPNPDRWLGPPLGAPPGFGAPAAFAASGSPFEPSRPNGEKSLYARWNVR